MAQNIPNQPLSDHMIMASIKSRDHFRHALTTSI